MDCSGHHHSNVVKTPRRLLQDCLDGPLNTSSPNYDSRTSLCPAAWDPIVELCWPSAMPGTKVSVPCPDTPGINTFHSACRECLPNGTWLIIDPQDPLQPYTNFHDCVVFELEEYHNKLGEIGKDKPALFDTLTNPATYVFWLHGVSLSLLFIFTFIWLLRWVYHEDRSRAMKYGFMTIACILFLPVHALDLVYSHLEYYMSLNHCYTFRILHTLFESLFYANILFYALMVITYVSEVPISMFLRKVFTCMCLVAIMAACGLEAWIEVIRPPHDVCIFGVYLNPFHWIILAFKLWLNGGTLCVSCVSMYGLVILKFPHHASIKRRKILQQNIVLLVVWILFCFIVQMFPIFLDHMYNIGYSIDALVHYTHVYNTIVASYGIVFVVVVCILDVEILSSMVPLVGDYNLRKEEKQIPRCDNEHTL